MGDLSVRADIDDVDPAHISLQVFNRLCDQPAGDKRLAKPDLVRDQESRRAVALSIQPAEDVLDRVVLKILQTRVDRRKIESDWLHVRNSSRASRIGSSTDSSPSGMSSRPSSVALRLPT